MNSNIILEKIFKNIQEIITDVVDINEEDISMDSSLQHDLKLDSLNAVEIILALEEELDIEISEGDIEKFDTVRDICNYVYSLSIMD